ncbi:MAG: DoxX family protein [Patescibacteria group bacterium]
MKLNIQTKLLVLLRVTLGALFVYTGLLKLFTPGWSAAGYLAGAKNFTALYAFLGQPGIIEWVSLINEWALTLLGVALITGLFLRVAAPLGALLMLLYYAVLPFPFQSPNSFLIDEHIIYALVLLVLASANAGRHLSIQALWRSRRTL